MTKTKDKELWNELFSPPCPNCGSLKTREELRDMPVICPMGEMMDRAKRQLEGKPNASIRTWTCLDCRSIFDENERSLIFKEKEER